MSEITYEELVALAMFCGMKIRDKQVEYQRHVELYDGSDFEPHISRDDAAMVEDAIEKAGKWSAYRGAFRDPYIESGMILMNDFLIHLSPLQRTEAALIALGIRKS